MRILFVTTKIDFERAGGSVPDLDRKVRDMQARGADVRVLTVFSELNQRPLDVPYPIEEERVGNKSLFLSNWSIFRFLRVYVREADVVHIEGQFAYAAALFRLTGGKPIVAFYNREMLSLEKKKSIRAVVRRVVEQILYRILVPHIDHFIFTTPQLAARYRDFGLHVSPARISITPDFIDKEAVKPHMREYAPKQKVTIFTSGRLIPEKGFDLFVDALALLDERIRKHISVVISGDGPERARLMQKAVKHDLTFIDFPGWVPKEDMVNTLAASDIFVYPRFHHELSSVLLMEALVLGLPSIVPGGGGLEWLAGDGALTFVNEDAASLAQAITTLVESPDKRMQLHANALARSEKFDHRTMAQTLLSTLSRASST